MASILSRPQCVKAYAHGKDDWQKSKGDAIHGSANYLRANAIHNSHTAILNCARCYFKCASGTVVIYIKFYALNYDV